MLGAYLEGWRRVVRAPALSASMFVVTLLAALPLSMVLGGMMREQLGASVLAEKPAWNWTPAGAPSLRRRRRASGAR